MDFKDVRQEFKEFLENGVALLDGAMGTMIQKLSLPQSETGGDNERLNLSHPEIISQIHTEYVLAGADIIETNTFNANRISQKDYGLEGSCYELSLAGAQIARKVSDTFAEKGRKIWVAGCVGPTTKSLSLVYDMDKPTERLFSFDDMSEAYRPQIKGLIDGGADFLLLETCFDALNIKAVLYALNQLHPGFPVIISVSVDKSHRTISGQTIQAFYNSIRFCNPLAFGLNCSLGAKEMLPLVEQVAGFSDVPVVCYPNAGLPNEVGEYVDTPENMAEIIGYMAERGWLNVAGGCCGTTPDHISAISKAVCGLKPHKVNPVCESFTASGLEAVSSASGFIIIGEKTNTAGSRKFARLISEKEYDSALQIAEEQVSSGAVVLDVNLDDPMLDSTTEMCNFARCASADPLVSKAALMIDSSHWDTIVSGLKNSQGRCVVNSLSLKEGEEDFLDKAKKIRDLGAAMVVIAFDENGQAITYSRKIAICERAYKLLIDNGIAPSDLVFDVNVLPIGTGISDHDACAADFIKAVRWIKKNLPMAHTVGGVSNVSFSFRGNNALRAIINSVFLHNAITAGLDMAIINPGKIIPYENIDKDVLKTVEAFVLDTEPDALGKVIELAHSLKEETSGEVKPEADCYGPEERVENAIFKGQNVEEKALDECYEKRGSVVDVIEGVFMKGMEKVGEEFSKGKLFLPQVLKSAKVMKTAVDYLRPRMKTSESAAAKPLYVIATVKGDVHDIGKNITAMVLGCNGFEIDDLGVMVDNEVIIREALKRGAEFVGVSGLITPSLFQMQQLCESLHSINSDIVLFVGGAAASSVHTAVKLAPLYEHVFYSPNASMSAVMAKRCLSDREAFEKEEHSNQLKIRELYEISHSGSVSVAKKESFASDCFPKNVDIPSVAPVELPLEKVIPFFDWDMFLLTLNVKRNEGDPRVAGYLEEGQKILTEWHERGYISLKYSYKFFRSFAEGNIIFADGIELPMLRNEGGSPDCLCDYLPDRSLGFRSPFGFFAISVSGPESESFDYENFIARAVRVNVAEAASRWMDEAFREYVSEEFKIIKPAIGYAGCPDHTMKADVLKVLGGEKLGIKLTESYAMIPDASICGFALFNKFAKYPEVKRISKAQLCGYAELRGMSEAEAEQFLGFLL
ncbi:MAG: homocysteine S-methyltransferase family protein [Bacteroidales bacterium]